MYVTAANIWWSLDGRNLAQHMGMAGGEAEAMLLHKVTVSDTVSCAAENASPLRGCQLRQCLSGFFPPHHSLAQAVPTGLLHLSSHRAPSCLRSHTRQPACWVTVVLEICSRYCCIASLRTCYGLNFLPQPHPLVFPFFPAGFQLQ